MKKDSRVKAVISLDAVEHNFREMRKNIAEETKMIAVIKADAYGHGAVPVAHLIEDYDYIWGFAAATAEEAIHLREAGITKPILILGIVFDEYFPELVRYEIRPAVCEYEEARKLSDEAVLQKKTVHIHIALDTGMTRIGFADTQENVEEIKKISELPNLEIEGMFTHFARADEKDKTSAKKQFEKFCSFIKQLEDLGVQIPIHQCANSAAMMEMSETSMNLARAGISMYGLYPSEEMNHEAMKLEQAMSIYSHVVHVKEIEAGTGISYGHTFIAEHNMKIATIPIGYGDGYPRNLSNQGYVLIHGQKAPIVGRVCMDQFMVDVTGMDIHVGDLVTLIGKDGREEILIDELSEQADVFNYEFVCDLGKRIPRVYIKNGEIVGTKDYYNDDYEINI